MLPPRHRRLIGCDIDFVCFKESLLEVTEVFQTQVFHEELDIARGEDVQSAGKVLVSALGIIST